MFGSPSSLLYQQDRWSRELKGTREEDEPSFWPWQLARWGVMCRDRECEIWEPSELDVWRLTCWKTVT